MRPQDPYLEGSEAAISRRRLLKRIGAGAAVAWSAPVLTSIRTPAFAQYSGSRCDPGQECVPDCDVLRPCQGNPNCGCFRMRHFDVCYCGDLRDGFCDSFPPCETQGECPAGEVCVESCCPTGICMPPCGLSSKRRFAGKGPKLTKPS
jgi:hypothetical protein